MSARKILFVVLFLLAGFVQAEELVPAVLEREPLPDSTITQTTPTIRIKFEDPKQELTKEQLFFEVDRSDVSSFVQLNEGALIYQPPAPLSSGKHEVRISGKLNDGRQIKEVIWNFQVEAAPETPSWKAGLEPTLTYEYGFRREPANPDRHRVNSNIAVNAQTLRGIQGNLTSNLQAQDNTGPERNDFDLANFQANLIAGQTSISLGDVLVNMDPLSVANLSRRGIFLQQKLPFRNAGVDFFSVRSESIFGFKHGLGISDGDQRIDGGSFFFSPVQNPSNMLLRVYYLTGENASQEGFNFGGVTRGSKGNAFGLNLNSSTFNGQLRTEGYAAWSDFDFSASDGFEGNKDRALQIRLVFDPVPKTWRNKQSKFSAQLEIQDIGLFFKTLGNPFLLSDRRGFNLNSSWNWGILGVTGGVSKFRDNVKDLEILPTVNNDVYTTGFNVTPQSASGQPVWPSFGVTASRSIQNSKNPSVDFLDLHNQVDAIAALVSFFRTKWSLNINTSYGTNTDFNDRVPDTDTKNITFAFLYTPAPFWNLGPSLSLTKLSNLDNGVDTDQTTVSMTSGIPLMPEKITVDSQLSYSHSETSDFFDRNSNFSGTAQLSFHLHQFLKKKGRQTFALRMSYNRFIIDAPFVSRQKGFEIFGLLDLGWPL